MNATMIGTMEVQIGAEQLEAVEQTDYRTDTPAYIPEWKRPDSPTRSLTTEQEVIEYYKANAVAGDCRFAIRADSGIPRDLQLVYAEILIELSKRKAKPADRKMIDQLRACWRDYVAGHGYTAPAMPEQTTTTRKARVSQCPHCGGTL